MEDLFLFLKLLTLLIYGIAFVNYLIFFITRNSKAERLCHPIFAVALLVHLFYLFVISQIRSHIPLMTRGEAMTMIVFCLSAIYFVVELRNQYKNLGVFVLGMAEVFQIASAFYIDEIKPVPEILMGGGFAFHAIANILGYSGFFLGFLFSILFLLFRYQIKKHRFGYIYERLPSLGILDTMSRHSIAMGFGLFTLGIIAGSIWANQAWGYYFRLDPKLILAIVVWAIYCIYLLLRLVPKWRPKHSAYLSIFAFTVLAFSFLLVTSITKSAHNF